MRNRINSILLLVAACILHMEGWAQNKSQQFVVPNSDISGSYHNICDTRESINTDGEQNYDATYRITIDRPAILVVNNAGSELTNTRITEHRVYPAWWGWCEDSSMISKTRDLWSTMPSHLLSQIEADIASILPEQVFFCQKIDKACTYRIINEGGELGPTPHNGKIKTNIYVYYLEKNIEDPIDLGTMSSSFSSVQTTHMYQSEIGINTYPVYYKFTLTKPFEISARNNTKYETKLVLLNDLWAQLDCSSNYPLSSDSSRQIVSHKLSAGTYYIASYKYDGPRFVTTTISGELLKLGDDAQFPIDFGEITDFVQSTVSYDTREFNDIYNGYFSPGRKDVYLKFTFPQDVEFALSPDDAQVGGAVVTLLTEKLQENGVIQTNVYPNTSLYRPRLAAGTYYIVLEGGESDGELGAEIRILPLNNLADSQWAPSLNMNYVTTLIPTYETSSPDYISPRLSNTTIKYYDHLGRPSQTNQYAATPDGHDLVSHQDYNVFGVVSKSYLPVDIGNTGGYMDANSIRSRGIILYNDSKPYQLTKFENTPLMRVVEQYGPGQDWQNARKSFTSNYDLNKDTIPRFAVAGSRLQPELIRQSAYAAKSLFVTTIIDEDGHSVHKFVDINGYNILTRMENGNEFLDTYSVYDDYGNLCFVLPPILSPNRITKEELNKYAFLYQYDYRNRCVGKKIPGIEWSYFVYDYADNLIFSQDGESRSRSEWSCTLYDKFKRPVISGIYNGFVDNQTINKQVISATFDRAGKYGYSFNLLNSDSIKVLSAKYYDTYDYKDILQEYTSNLDYVDDADYGNWFNRYAYATKGLVTGSLTAVLDEDTRVCNATYYDANKRPIQVRTATPDGGFSVQKFRYDFTGNVVKSCAIEQPTAATSADTLLQSNQYDKTGHLLRTKSSLNGIASAVVSYEYDNIGQLVATIQGEGPDAIRTEKKYNIRGWLTEQNNNLFSMQLKYLDSELAEPSYTGNIMEWRWKHQDQATEQTYAFTYDALSRLTDTRQYEGGTLTNRNVERGMTYDRNGNMLSLSRYAEGLMSSSYCYNYNGNQLTSLTTPSVDLNTSMHPIENNLGDTFNYDLNGNMVYDALHNRELQYNQLNLLRKVSESSTTYADYRYLADGTKLSVQDQQGNGLVYQGSLVYRKQGDKFSLESAAVAGGRIVASQTATGTSYYPHYYISDHLGSTRAISDGTAANTVSYDYYPFGKQWSNPEMQITNNRDLFNGKEWQPIGNVNLLDYGARMYDSELGMWQNIDPKANMYTAISPYAYCINNPLKYADARGEHPVIIIGGIAISIVDIALITTGIATTGVVWQISQQDGSLELTPSMRSLFKSNPEWKHQQRKDRHGQIELNQAQANVQNSINDNFPNPNDYDPNKNPNVKRGEKLTAATALLLYFGGTLSDVDKLTIIYYLNLFDELINNSDEDKKNSKVSPEEENSKEKNKSDQHGDESEKNLNFIKTPFYIKYSDYLQTVIPN